MFEKILVTLDGSELAEVALPYAEELADKLGSLITLLYVSESKDEKYRSMQESYVQNLAKSHLQREERKGGNVAVKQIKVDSKVLVGNPAEEIIDFADREKMELIIMSTHGRTGIRRWAVGSVADKILKAASQPIALIRAKGSRTDMRERDLLDKVLVPLDGTKGSEAVLPYIGDLASRLNLEVTFLQALEMDYMITSQTQLKQIESLRSSAQTYIQGIAAQFKQKGINAKSEYREAAQDPNGVVGVISKMADEMQADFVAMSTRGHSASDVVPGEWVTTLGSVAEKMVHSGNTPLLLVKPPPKNKK